MTSLPRAALVGLELIQRGENGHSVLRSKRGSRSAEFNGSPAPTDHQRRYPPLGYSPVAAGLASLSSRRWPSGSRKKQRTSQPWSTGGVRNSAPRPRSVS